MNDTDAQPEELNEILRLATALAEQFLQSKTEESAHPERLKALISAAQFLHEHDVAWPPALREAVGNAVQRMEAVRGR
ncbi:hypothetical protein [Methylobacterium sp. A52T]